MKTYEYITSLTAPSAISEQTRGILDMFYSYYLVYEGGLRLKRDDVNPNTFYICCPTMAEKEVVEKIVKETENWLLVSHNIDKPRVIFLPEGIEPRTV